MSDLCVELLYFMVLWVPLSEIWWDDYTRWIWKGRNLLWDSVPLFSWRGLRKAWRHVRKLDSRPEFQPVISQTPVRRTTIVQTCQIQAPIGGICAGIYYCEW